MNKFMFLVISLSSLTSIACPDFSGKYVDVTQKEPVYIDIVQNGCEKVTIYKHEAEGTVKQVLNTDGVKRLTHKSVSLLIYELSQFNNLGNLYFEYDNHWLNINTIYHTRIFYVLEDDKNVTEYRHFFEGDEYLKTQKTIFIRKVMPTGILK